MARRKGMTRRRGPRRYKTMKRRVKRHQGRKRTRVNRMKGGKRRRNTRKQMKGGSNMLWTNNPHRNDLIANDLIANDFKERTKRYFHMERPEKRTLRPEKRTLGFFNMSFASDLGIVPNKHEIIGGRQDSEATFLLNTPENDRRKFWKNSLELLTAFIRTKTPIAIGLVELNKWKNPDGTQKSLKKMGLEAKGFSSWDEWNKYNNNEQNKLKGIEAIEDMLKKHKKYTCYYAPASPPYGDFYNMCIWDKELLGETKYANVYTMERDPARAIIFIYTTEKILLIVLHAGQPQTTTEEHLDHVQNDIDNKARTFLVENKIITNTDDTGSISENVKDCIVFGDFNAKEIDLKKLKMFDKFSFVNKRNGKKTCCYNWDSVNINDEDLPNKITRKDKHFIRETVELPRRNRNSTIKRLNKITTEIPTAGVGKRIPLKGKDGKDLAPISEYKYFGDFIFTKNGADNHIFRPDNFKHDGVSKESDHEFVYAESRINIAAERSRRLTFLGSIG